MDIRKFTQRSVEAIQGAQSIAIEHNNQQVDEEHLLLALLEQEDSLIASLLTRMGKDADFMRQALVPGGNVSPARIAAAASGEGLASLFNTRLLKDAAALGAAAVDGGTMTAFELACDNAVMAYMADAKLTAYGEEPVIAYMAAVESEITTIRMILTGRLAGIEPQVIRERLRDMYA